MKVSVTNLSCRRGEIEVLAGVSFSLDTGHTLILRGPNGSGKSTLLRVLAGLAPATSGTLSVSPETIAYAGHLDGIKAQLTVSENLRFWASVFGTPDIDAATSAFDLANLLDRPAYSLSAGQKRRLGLARLLVADRPVWVLDEPTVSLDAQNVARFARLVQDHNAGGGSAIIATHIDLGLARAATLDITRFKATESGDGNPFLDEALS